MRQQDRRGLRIPLIQSLENCYLVTVCEGAGINDNAPITGRSHDPGVRALKRPG
jgi:hypothetical protein